MKPTSDTIDNRKRSDLFADGAARRFPITDCNYQAVVLGRFNGGQSGNSARSFLSISRDYFRNEARWNFLAEVLFFAVIIAIAAVPLINGARAIMHFLHLPAA